MTAVLDKSLVFRAKRKVRRGELTQAEAIAINLFRREGVSALRLAKVFGVSPNTIYYRCLTGKADSYVQNTPHAVKSAIEANRVIDAMGEKKAWAQYVTPKMVREVHGELEQELMRRE